MTDHSQPNSAEHTPTPWFFSDPENGGIGHINSNPEGSFYGDIATVWSDGLANAAFIVKAVNNHDALVKALEGVAEFCSADTTTLGAISRLTAIRNTALNVLAAVEAKP